MDDVLLKMSHLASEAVLDKVLTALDEASLGLELLSTFGRKSPVFIESISENTNVLTSAAIRTFNVIALLTENIPIHPDATDDLKEREELLLRIERQRSNLRRQFSAPRPS